MIDPLVRPPIVKQCELLNLSRSTYYYAPKGESDKSLKLMDKIDRIYMEHPFMGSRQITATLWHSGIEVNRKRVQRLMRLMGISSIAPSPHTTKPKVGHHKYPYLLRDLAIEHPNQVWATDITYIPMSKGFMYLVAILDLHSRKVLSWRISNTMTVDFCIQALREAIRVHGIPEIFNTDQGSQFTADEFTSELVSHGIMISMDGKGRAIDNVFVERLWRTVKYEHVYINPANDGLELRVGLKSYFEWYNTTRPHSSLDNMTPDEIYYLTHETDGLQVA